MKKLVILGGGYGGVALIQELFSSYLPPDLEVVLIDRMPYQGLKTEYYAVAAGTVADTEVRIKFPNHDKLSIHYGEVASVDLESKLVHLLNDDPVEYDELAIALGCTDRYHGVPGAEEFTCSLQSFSGARETYLKLNNLKPYSQVHIIGGGLSGIELAADLRESRPDLNIAILDRGVRVLSSFPNRLSAYVQRWFSEHNVEIHSGVSVSRVEKDAVYNMDQPIPTDITVWTAGIQPVSVVQNLDLPKDRSGRILLNELYQIPSYPEVYVIGDCASLPFVPSAQAAGAQAEQIGCAMKALWRGDTPKVHPLKLKGTLGSLGKRAGFGLMGNTSVIGRVPRLLKSGVLWKSKRSF
ncbi:NAD(P)/FAD-dependent oxidoreductase [Paenibacillus faecalis]|uniref:NAD(P)/FAD-dependent oxidoreductase n=1 Tax=Paenibacillus faecalis TaxID=2079532 RepID=UPI000D0E81D5|nr:NAD(P)/FAD-dependent oxidoreductase [Paenibacillus faecalis]